MCQGMEVDEWIDKQQENVLDVPYFHAVFTIPEEMYSLVYSNQRRLYDALYHAAHLTMTELIVLGGGLDTGNHWKDKGGNFFFPVKVMSAVFKKHYLKELKELRELEKQQYHGSCAELRNHYSFKELLNKLYAKDWIVYIKKAFNGANSVIRYLGRYTHRIAISNRRIIGMTEETVTYLVKDYKNEGKMIPYTVDGTEFLRMFLMHVLPKGFVRIRHYGILSCRCKREKMKLCRKLLNCVQYLSRLRDKTVTEKLMILYRRDICKCEACGGKLLSARVRGNYTLTG